MDKNNEKIKIFLNACRDGDLKQVKYFLKNGGDIHAKGIQRDDAIWHASNYGHLHIIKYLLTSPELKEHINLKGNAWSLTNASAHGYLNIVRYLLTSSELKEHTDIHIQDDRALIVACAQGRFEIVDYLLTSPELMEHANIDGNSGAALVCAARHGFLKIVKFLLMSPKLKEHGDVQYNDNAALKEAAKNGHLHMVKYLLKFQGLNASDINLQENECKENVWQWLQKQKILPELQELKKYKKLNRKQQIKIL